MLETDTLLIELGVEELPPRQLPALGDAFARQLAEALQEAGFEHDGCRAFYTPRRLAVQVFNLVGEPGELTATRTGPAVADAYDADGKPTKAALGFAKACGVEVDDLEVREEKGKKKLACVSTVFGHSLDEALSGILEQVVRALPQTKKMRWSEDKLGFIRPVRWLCALYGERVVDCRLFDLQADRCTCGHRCHCPEPLALSCAEDYEQVLEEGKVIADFDKRRLRIEELAKAHADGAVVDMSDDSLSILAGLTEWPQIIAARFDEAFLSLPPPVLLQVLKDNVKVLPLTDTKGNLLPKFLIVANVESSDPTLIQRGYENVAQTRLADAQFFYQQDQKVPFVDRYDRLKNISFQEKLGTLADKVGRLERLAGNIAQACGADPKQVQAAALMCKCDLTTDMVGEYPALEGIIGEYYASSAADAAVATAIGEHYRPRYAGDALPATPAGIALALADKMDNLVGLFGIDRPPTGAKDPFALRRAAIGIVRILIEHKIVLDLDQFIAAAIAAYGQSLSNADSACQVFEFLNKRLIDYCWEHDFAFDHIDAVIAVRPTSPIDFVRRLEVMKAFMQMPEAQSLTAANKRIVNLVSKQTEQTADDGELQAKTLTEPAEKELFERLCECQSEVLPLLEQAQYLQAIQVLVKLHAPIDRFFDEVLVMSDDDGERRRRLALLRQVGRLFLSIADFSKLQGKKE